MSDWKEEEIERLKRMQSEAYPHKTIGGTYTDTAIRDIYQALLKLLQQRLEESQNVGERLH